MRSEPRLLLALAALATRAAAQVASSANYRLEDFAFAGGGGGQCSLAFAGAVALPGIAGAEMASGSYRASIGFLAAFDPQPTNAPVVFGLTPDVGPVTGGTPALVSGLNFDKLGAAPTIAVSIGGAPAGPVSVYSDSWLLCTTPALPAGIHDVTVSSVHGSDTLAGGFRASNGLVVYGTGTPGCAGTQTVHAGGPPRVDSPSFFLFCDHAPANSQGILLAGTSADSAGSDPFGWGILLHVDVLASTDLMALDMASDPGGLGFAPAKIPNDPALVGVTYHVQAIWHWAGACPLGPLGLSSSRGLSVTIE
jgi:hypothetical protein